MTTNLQYKSRISLSCILTSTRLFPFYFIRVHSALYANRKARIQLKVRFVQFHLMTRSLFWMARVRGKRHHKLSGVLAKAGRQSVSGKMQSGGIPCYMDQLHTWF